MPRFLQSLTLSFLIVLFLSTASLAADSVYTVKAGDSLWSIAHRNGVTVEHLKQINALPSDFLQIGDKLKIHQNANPVVSQANTPVPVQGQYTVQAGDSLWSIAHRHNITVARLKEFNGLNTDFIKIGQTLNIGTVVSANPPAPNPVNNPSRSGENIQGARIIEFAAGYLGTPYAYGGQSPRGFDCSGFSSYIYKQFGYSLPRTAAGQYTLGTAIERSNLEAGDLVFFACSRSGIDHVGIYCDNNRFIHSSSPRSGGVIYSSLSEGYYAKYYIGAKRITY